MFIFYRLNFSFGFFTFGNTSALDIAFQTVSIITTTGYTSTDYSSWNLYITISALYFDVYRGYGRFNGGGIKIIRIVAFINMLESS